MSNRVSKDGNHQPLFLEQKVLTMEKSKMGPMGTFKFLD